MRITINFNKTASFLLKELSLELLVYFKPMKITVHPDFHNWYDAKQHIILEGAEPLNPWDALEQICSKLKTTIQGFESLTYYISSIELENAGEKEK